MKPTWYEYRYCRYCGTELERTEGPSTIEFNPYTGKPFTYLVWKCPHWSSKTTTKHYYVYGAYDLEEGDDE